MTTGWRFIGGSWYLFADGGTMLTDWQKTDAIWYYLGGSDTIATDWRYIDGAWYYFYRLFSTYGGQHSCISLSTWYPDSRVLPAEGFGSKVRYGCLRQAC